MKSSKQKLHNTQPQFYYPDILEINFQAQKYINFLKVNVDGKNKQLVHFTSQEHRAQHRKYLDERGQQNTAHLLLQNDLVLTVVVTSGDKRREQHFDQLRVTEILEGQLAELLQHRWVAAGLHDDLKRRRPQVNCQKAPAAPWPFPHQHASKNHGEHREVVYGGKTRES